jgi:hypothetical protein
MIEASTVTEYRVVDTTQFGFNGKWQATDLLVFATMSITQVRARFRRQGYVGGLRHRG